MHKKLEAELISLAHQILQMKDKDDVIKIRDKAKDLYEKSAVLAFVENYFKDTPNATEDKTAIVETLTKVTTETADEKKETPILAPAENTEVIEEETPVAKNETKDAAPDQGSLENNEEFKDSIAADVAANLFEKAETPSAPKVKEVPPVVENKEPESAPVKEAPKPAPVNVAAKKELEPAKKEVKQESKASLNDRLFSNKIQVGLNDRIAFVKHLFNFSQEDFNRVLSQLNTMETEAAAKEFINTQVKPDYDWTDKEEYEERLLNLVERKFL